MLKTQEQLLDKAERELESNRIKRQERKSIRDINRREQNRRNNAAGEINIGDVQGNRGSVRNQSFYETPIENMSNSDFMDRKLSERIKKNI